MNLSRRSFLGAAAATVAGSAAASAASSWSSPALAASPAGDVVGKIAVGYQGWFACIGDGAPINGWWHWSQNWSQPPSPSNDALKGGAATGGGNHNAQETHSHPRTHTRTH